MYSVVLIDDDPATCNIVQTILEYHHLNVTTFICPQAASTFLQTHQPDVLILDLYLETTTGYKMLKQFRAQAPGARIVATTAHQMGGTLGEVLRHGFDGYLPKPIDADTLLPFLRRIEQMSARPK